MKRAILSAGGFLFSLLLLAAIGCGTAPDTSAAAEASKNAEQRRQAGDTIKVGVLLPRTGPFQMYGADFLEGIECFYENRRRILDEDGSEIELVYYDNESTEEGTLEGCRELIDFHAVDIILGPLSSRNAGPAIELCTKKTVPIMPLWATADDLVGDSPYAHRIIYSDSFTGFLIGKFSVENLRSRKAAVVYTDVFSSLKNGFVQAYDELHTRGEVREYHIDQGTEDIFSALEDFSPDVIYLAHKSALNKSGEFIRQAEARGISSIYLGDTDWSALDPEELKRQFESDLYFLNHFSPDAYNRTGRLFAELYRQSRGTSPSGLAALSYEALLVISQAAQAGSAERSGLLKSLREEDFEGLLGTLRFEESGDVQKSGVFSKISGGRTEYITTVVPEVFSLKEFEEAVTRMPEETGEKPRISILSLEGRNVNETDTLILTELISSSIIRTRHYQVIEAGQRDKILAEAKFSMTGLTEENQIEIGKLLAARKMIAGSISLLEEKYLLNIRILDVETGETLYATYKVYDSMSEVIEDCDFFTYELISKDLGI
jgi:branched-chain amino acid transport system substrate-binding protein